MERLPRLTIADTITREAGVTRACYALKGNQPARLRRGQVFTVDGSIRRQDGGLSELAIPHEPLAPGPQGRLFAVDATDCASGVARSRPDLDRPGPDDFTIDQDRDETHCRNVYFTAMATYEAFARRAWPSRGLGLLAAGSPPPAAPAALWAERAERLL